MTRDLSRHRVRNLHTLGDLCTVLVQPVALCAVSKLKCRQNTSNPWRPQAHSVRSGAQSQLISVQISGGLLLRLRVLRPFQGDSRANLQRSQIRGTDSSPSRSRAKASLLEKRVPLHQISVHIWGGLIQTSVELGCPQGGPGPNSWVLNQMVSRTHPFLRSSHVRTAGPRLQTGVLSCESGRTNPISSNLGTPQWLPGAFRR